MKRDDSYKDNFVLHDAFYDESMNLKLISTKRMIAFERIFGGGRGEERRRAHKIMERSFTRNLHQSTQMVEKWEREKRGERHSIHFRKHSLAISKTSLKKSRILLTFLSTSYRLTYTK